MGQERRMQNSRTLAFNRNQTDQLRACAMQRANRLTHEGRPEPARGVTVWEMFQQSVHVLPTESASKGLRTVDYVIVCRVVLYPAHDVPTSYASHALSFDCIESSYVICTTNTEYSSIST